MVPTRVFLDYAAATPLSPKARDAMIEASSYFANPQALHTEGLAAARVIDLARRSIAKTLGVKASRLFFTSGGTEANNLAIAGYLNSLEKDMQDMHVVISSIEHPSVYDVLTPFIQKGLQVSEVPPNEKGEIKPEAIEAALTESTVLVSVALVNSEIGTVQPLHAISQKLKDKHIVLHTDAGQGLYQPLMPQGLGVDLMSFDSGKMYGPRGVGALYVRSGLHLHPVLRGGSQEDGLRPGTENTALIAGFAAAFEEMLELRDEEGKRLNVLRNIALERMTESIPGLVINGEGKNQSPHILNVSVPHIDAEYIALYMDQRGVALSTKSACLERSDSEVSSVVAALAGDTWRARNTLRLSFGRETTTEDVETAIAQLQEAVAVYQGF